MTEKEPVERSAFGFQMAVIGQMLLVAVPALAISVCMFPFGRVELCMGVLALGVVASIWVRNRAYRRFRCPECGLHIPQSKKGQHYIGDYKFYCHKCQIAWVCHCGE